MRKLPAMSTDRTRRPCTTENKESSVLPVGGNRKRAVALKLTVLARHLRQNFDHSVERSGLTRAKWTLIAAVAHRQGATQRILAEALEVREITVGRLIDRLCDEGYLKRRPHPSDGRAYCVYLAPGAQPILDTLDEVAKGHEAAMFAGFSDSDLDKLLALLDVVAANLLAARSRDETKK
jgi:MarR family transcriptional regulator, transcriptional regulator for hemolysin